MESKGKTPAGVTVDDLLARIDQLAGEVLALKAERAAIRPIGKITPDDLQSKIVRPDHPAPGGGYIVAMPREWNGERMGIQFRAGIGIIDAALPDCDARAHWFEADYHYDVVAADAEQLTQMRRKLEGVPLEGRSKTTPEKLMTAQQAGVVRQ
jgi:hypothetical protein